MLIWIITNSYSDFVCSNNLENTLRLSQEFREATLCIVYTHSTNSDSNSVQEYILNVVITEKPSGKSKPMTELNA